MKFNFGAENLFNCNYKSISILFRHYQLQTLVNSCLEYSFNRFILLLFHIDFEESYHTFPHFQFYSHVQHN